VLVLLLVLVLDLLAIRAEKRVRSFGNCSVPASVAAERAVFSITSTSRCTSTISNFRDLGYHRPLHPDLVYSEIIPIDLSHVSTN